MELADRKALDNALMDFYLKLLKPEFDAIKAQLAEHDEQIDKILSLMQSAAAKRPLNS